MRKHKFAVWALIFFLPTFVFILCPAAYVFLVDPLWQWDHPWHLKRWHPRFNERLQKTNYIGSHEVYIDTLIVGSSRSTFFNPTWLGTKNGFNYGVSSGRLTEYAPFIKYVKQKSRLPLKQVLIESSPSQIMRLNNSFEPPEFYIKNAEDKAKKFRNLFSHDAYKRARNVTIEPRYEYYIIENRGEHTYKYPHIRYTTDEQKQRFVDYELKSYAENVYNKPYSERFVENISEVHQAAGEADCIVWTTPVSWKLLNLFYDMGKMDHYERWLRALVAEFGRVYHFDYPNKITMNEASFNDAQHPTFETALLTMKIIRELRESGTGENTEYGGVVLTPENIDYWINVFRRQFAALQ